MAAELAVILRRYDKALQHLDGIKRFREERIEALRLDRSRYGNALVNTLSFWKGFSLEVIADLLSRRFEEGFKVFSFLKNLNLFPVLGIGVEPCMKLDYRRVGGRVNRVHRQCDEVIYALHLLRFLAVAGMRGLLTDRDLEAVSRGIFVFGKEVYNVFNRVVEEHDEELRRVYGELGIPEKDYLSEKSCIKRLFEEFSGEERHRFRASLLGIVELFRYAYKEGISRDVYIYEDHI